MPQTLDSLDLVLRPDLGSDVDVLSLADWLVMPDGWSQGTAGDDDVSVDEVLTLNIDGSSHDDLADSLQELDAKRQQIRWARNPLQPNGVWLRTKLKNETNARQAFLLNSKPGKLRVTSEMTAQDLLYQYTLGLTRMPVWESISPATVATSGEVNANGGVLDYTLAGDRPGRIALCTLTGGTSFLALSLKRFWIGVKSDQYGTTPANFSPVWNLRKGTAGTDTTLGTANSEATALDGYKVVCTFATDATLKPRVTMTVSQAVASNYADQRGTYLALLRARTTSSLVARVRIGKSWYNLAPTTAFSYNPRSNEINSTTWHYYELGPVRIPTGSDVLTHSLELAALRIDAEKVSGSGNLEMDALILIPLDAQIAVSASAYAIIVLSETAIESAEIYHLPDDRISAQVINLDSATPQPLETMAVESKNEWGLPPGSGRIVFAAEDDTTGSVGNYTLEAALSVYTRFTTLRGDQ